MTRLSYRASIDFLFNLEKTGVKLGLDTTYRLLDAIGNPQDHFDSVHVAGTNGKGSVACFLNSILFHNGLAAGLFTSPHLVSYRERIRKNGVCISRRALADTVSGLAVPIRDTRVSYFEASTVLAFEYFRKQKVQVAVVEVGMGGRLDSTNVLHPLASCITSIDFDHVKYLGKTISKIAGEKAGIIKRGVPVVCGPLSPQASRTIRRIARRRDARVLEVGKDASVRRVNAALDGSTFEYAGLARKRSLSIRTPGFHQVTNAATAVLLAEVLNEVGLRITDRAIARGLERAFWPGRLQILRRRPLMVCDAAHNVSGVRALTRTLRDIGFRSDVTVFGVLRDKDYAKMMSLLRRCSDGFILTKPASPRALPLYKLKAAAKDLGVRFDSCSSVDKAVGGAVGSTFPGGRVLVCGSLYALGEAMEAVGFKPHLSGLC
jgi:dihydrofolate synthase/folylpolyglutamate synthase